jgi:hypothetical protein
MDDAKRDLVRAWLIKGRNDLDTARQIGRLPDGHLDTAIYHCQQAAASARRSSAKHLNGWDPGEGRRLPAFDAALKGGELDRLGQPGHHVDFAR